MATALGFRLKKLENTRRRVNLPVSNSAKKAVIATDLTGKVVFWNLVAEGLYGWKWHEAVGRPISELVVPESRQASAAEIMEQLRQGKSWTGEFKLRHRDGTEFLATITDQPMQDRAGNLIGIIGISQPVKRSKRANRTSSVRAARIRRER